MALVVAGLSVSAQERGANNMRISLGSLTVAPSALANGGCLQIPVLIRDLGTAGGGDGFDLSQITFTVQIQGDTSVIAGGLDQQFLAANGFTNGDTTGITNPATDLTQQGGATANVTCSNGINQATLGSGPAIDFPAGQPDLVNVQTSIGGNNSIKQATLLDFSFTTPLGTTDPSADQLVGVIELPIIANPGTAQLTVRLVPDAEVDGGNIFGYETDSRAQINEDFELGSNATIKIFEAVDCSGAVAADGLTGGASGTDIAIDYQDPAFGGNGGTVNFTFTHPTTVGQIRVTGNDGFDRTIAADASGTTTLSINTATDGSPAASNTSTTYSVTYGVEFPPASGTFAFGSACAVNVTWNAPTATIAADPDAPQPNDPVNFDISLTNVVVQGGNQVGTFTTPGGANTTITVADVTNNAGNLVSVNNFGAIANVDPATDAGTYTVSTTGPHGQTASGTDAIGFECPDSDDFNMSSANVSNNTDVLVGGTVTVTPDTSAVAVLGYDFAYAGHNGGAAVENQTGALNFNAVAGQDNFYVRARGFGEVSPGNFAACFQPSAAGDNIVENPLPGVTGFWYEYSIDWAPAVCADGANAQLQLGGGSVPPFDVGQNITVELVGLSGGSVDINRELNILSATISGVAFTQTNPGRWVANNVPATIGMQVMIVGVDGTQQTCSQSFLTVDDFNCTVESATFFASLNQAVTFVGTQGCTFELYQSSTPGMTDVSGLSPVSTVTVTDDRGDGFGSATFPNFVAQPDSYYYIVIAGDTTVLSSSAGATVPTLGEWGMIFFVTLLMGAALVTMRRQRNA